jgi:alkylated DNA repair dioxygenase AlkB
MGSVGAMHSGEQTSVSPAAARSLAPLAPERLWLDKTSWVDVQRGWVLDADRVYEQLVEGTAWNQGRVFRYEKWIDEPRLGSFRRTDDPNAHPVLIDAHRELQAHYRVKFDGFALAYYRDGRDSVAFHRDREMRWLDDTVIGVLTLGATRPWQLRPRANRYDHEAPNRGATHDFRPASGDLLVLGGRCQADWEHAVPKVHALTKGRVSVQWRYTSRQGRPQTGGNYRSPRYFNR